MRVTLEDDDGGSGTDLFRVAITDPPPTIECPVDVVVEFPSAEVALGMADTAGGLCEGLRVFNYAVGVFDAGEEPVTKAEFPIGSSEVIWVAENNQKLIDPEDPQGTISLREECTQSVTVLADTTCDVDADGDVDRNDIDAIFAARGTAATGPDDPMDANADGIISVNDGRICVLECTNPDCAVSPPPVAISSAPLSCGLLGIEPLVLVGLPLWARRRRATWRESRSSEISGTWPGHAASGFQ